MIDNVFIISKSHRDIRICQLEQYSSGCWAWTARPLPPIPKLLYSEDGECRRPVADGKNGLKARIAKQAETDAGFRKKAAKMFRIRVYPICSGWEFREKHIAVLSDQTAAIPARAGACGRPLR